MDTILWVLVGIGAWTTLTSAAIWLRDRSGASGAYGHIDNNPRIDGPDDRIDRRRG